MPPRLLLTYPPAPEFPSCLPLLFSSNAFPFKSSRFEPAGHSFHALALRLFGFEAKSEDEERDDAAPENKEKISSASSDSFQFKGKKKSTLGQEQQDHYALLGLGHLRYLASEDQIRKCYREAALKHHPDKQASLLLAEESEEAKAAKKEEIDHHFKAIQEAYEVLIDPLKRRIYDSTDEFDDAIPGDCASQDFFKVFGPVFVRNGRWSVIQSVPSLGSDETPSDEVDKFYDFWYSFKSWREFPHADEYDLELAESREHKRWMERQNAKLREKARKEENARIFSLVENAYKRDPRIARRKEEEKAEKQRKKQAKLQARKDKEDEAARLLEEERLRKEQEEKRAAEEAAAQKKSKEREKKLLRKEKSRLRAAASEVVSRKVLGISDDDIENLCMALEIDDLRRLCDDMEKKDLQQQGHILKQVLGGQKDSSSAGPGSTTSEAANSCITEDQKRKIGVSEEVNKPVSMLNLTEKKERPWGKEEVELLRKAMQKYPKGTAQRWEVVSNYIGTNRSVDEIRRAINTVLLQKPDPSKAFDSFLEKRKVPNVVIASPLSTRDDSPDAPLQPTSSTSVANGNLKDVMDSKRKVMDSTKNIPPKEITEEVEKQPVPNASQPCANGSAPNPEQDVWSDVQEGALVKALKAFPKDTPQRWDRIAAAVPGKSKGQCFKKFAELRENFRSRKGTD